MIDIWLYELDFPKHMEINLDNVWLNLKIKHISSDLEISDTNIQELVSQYSHNIEDDDFDGCLPTICNYIRNDVSAIRGFLDGISYITNSCDYYNFTNAQYHKYQQVFQDLYNTTCYNNGYIPGKEVIECQ